MERLTIPDKRIDEHTTRRKKENAKLLHGDCLELMKAIPDGSVDLVVTDPPYKLTPGGRVGTLLPTKDTPFSQSGECFSSKTPDYKAWVPEIYRVLKPQSYAFIMTNDRNLKTLWDVAEKNKLVFCEILVMNKNTAVSSCYFYKSCEFILMVRKGNYRKLEKFGTKTVFDVKMPKGKHKKHPTEKPIGILEKLISDTTAKGECVLDPFMGSGSTGVACVNTGRRFIGIELDEVYYQIAKDRIAEAAMLKSETQILETTPEHMKALLEADRAARRKEE